jgi:CDP-diacylglycerol--serine O-phosphatidyltransferase
LLITVASAYRLAKFNVDTRQISSFIGLPTPANTLLILSLPLILTFQGSQEITHFILRPWFLIAITVVSCILLNTEVPLFALKFKTWNLKTNAVRYTFLLVSFICLVLFKFIAIPVSILLYILISIFWKPEV